MSLVMNRKIWLILLAVWLLLWGLLHITNFRFDGENLIMGVLAIAAAILIAFDK